jgi:hypothetical protein
MGDNGIESQYGKIKSVKVSVLHTKQHKMKDKDEERKSSLESILSELITI